MPSPSNTGCTDRMYSSIKPSLRNVETSAAPPTSQMSLIKRWRSASTNVPASLAMNSTCGCSPPGAREHVGVLFAVGPFAEAEDLFVSVPTHYQSLDGIEERSVTVVAIGIEPTDTAGARRDETIGAGSDV